MDQSAQYGQMDFNLPHDVVKLPSGGETYKPKKESLKVGYLTAMDENIIMSQNTAKEGLIYSLLKNKIYEPGFDVNQLIDSDVKAILLFLRNTAFGPDYTYMLTDPKTGNKFEATLIFDEVNYIYSQHKKNVNGNFEYVLPKSNKKVELKLLTLNDSKELDKIEEQYPTGMVAPIVTKRLEKHIVSIEGDASRENISRFINQMPISDSKSLRKFISECEPKLDVKKSVTAPSGEKVNVELTFGAEFFRPFFSL
jgi:hypothetical protein